MKVNLKEILFKNWHLIFYILILLSYKENIYYTLPLIILGLGIVLIQSIYKKNYNSYLQLVISLLFFSLLYMRSIHTFLLILAIVSYIIYGIKFKNFYWKLIPKRKLFFNFLVFFLGLYIYLSFYFYQGNFYKADKYLIIILYVLLILLIDTSTLNNRKLFISYIISIWISIPLLFFINPIIVQNINVKFANPIGLTHVYYGFFLGFSILLCIYLYKDKFSLIKLIAINIAPFLCLIYIGSRIALFSTVLVLIIMAYYYVKPLYFSFLLILNLVFVGLILNTPRFKVEMDKIQKIYIAIKTNDKQYLIDNSWDNSISRYLAEKQAVKEMLKHPIKGVGMHKVITTIYQKVKNEEYIYFPKINTHNQYLQFGLGLGIPFLLFFVFTILYGLKISINKELFLFFIIFAGIIMLGESILERIKGISFFYLFLLWIANFKIEK